MKSLFQLTNLVLLLLTVSFSTVHAQSIPEILYYRFDRTDNIAINEASGTTAQTDTAYLMGALSQDSIGQCGNALVGSGISSSTDYVNTGWAPDLGNKSWTISFWTNNVTGTSTLYYVFGDVNTSSLRCFTNGVAGSGNWVLRGAGLTDIYANGGATTGPSMTTFTYDSASAQSKAYVNGVLVSTVVQSTPALTGTGPFKVNGYSTNTGLPAGGLMDEFRFYNRALSDVEILDLFDLSTSSNTVIAMCDSMISPSGMHTWTTSGIYNDTIPNNAGCDSIITFDLTILSPSYSSLTTSACNSYQAPSGTIFSTTGLYQDIIANNAGCDSIIDIDLTIESVDTSVSVNGITLTANSSTGTFQWVDCNDGFSPISGETNQSFTPTINGSYALIISDACTDTSACFIINNVGIDAAQILNTEVFPNPNTGQFVIKSSKIPEFISVSDLIGNEVVQIIPQEYTSAVSLVDFSAGVYYVHVTSNNVTQHIKIVVTQ